MHSMNNTPIRQRAVRLPPPPPLHRPDQWEVSLYQLAQEAGSQLFRDSRENVNNFGASRDVSTSLSDNRSPNTPSSSRSDLHSIIRPTHTNILGELIIDAMTLDSDSDHDSEDIQRPTFNRMSSDMSSHSLRNISSFKQRARPTNQSSDYDVPHVDVVPVASKTSIFDTPLRRPNAGASRDLIRAHSIRRPLVADQLFATISADLLKQGYLTKSGGFKSHVRWFVLTPFQLTAYKSEQDETRKSKPELKITLTPNCKVTSIGQQNGDKNIWPFKLVTKEKTYQLVADSIAARDEWVKILTNAINMSDITLTSLESSEISHEGSVTMIRHGLPRRCWATLKQHQIFFLKSMSDPTPISYIPLREAKIREVVDIYESNSSDDVIQSSQARMSGCSLAIYPKYSRETDPTYINVGSQDELDRWFHHLAAATCIDQSTGTCYEQSLFKLMMRRHDQSAPPVDNYYHNPIRSCIWLEYRSLVYTDKPLTSSLTTMPNELLKKKALDLFRSIQLFTQVPIDPVGIDYHVCLLQDCLQKYLDHPELRNEFFAQLTKQTTYIKHRCQVKIDDDPFNNNQSDLCELELEPLKFHTVVTDLDAVAQTNPSYDESPRRQGTVSMKDRDPLLPAGIESSVTAIPTSTEILQGLQILSLAVSLSTPRGRIGWWLKDHLTRCAMSKSEPGEYASYCLKALERTQQNGPREFVPSRTEILGILMRNPNQHSHPHSIPIHLSDGTYVLIGVDGSTTIEEFMLSLCKQIHIRRSKFSDFYVFANDPLDSSQPLVEPQRKLMDVIGWWEQTLRRAHSGRFENTNIIKLMCKKRFLLDRAPQETDRERLLIVRQINEEIVSGRLALTPTLVLELGALATQMTLGNSPDRSASDHGRSKSVVEAMNAFLPNLDRFPSADNFGLEQEFRQRWSRLCGRLPQDCARIYLNCARQLIRSNDEA